MKPRFRRTRAVRPFHAPALIAGAIVLAACGTEADDATAPAPSARAEIGHIHGVAMDPADASVYVAAHFGVFKIESPGRVSRVGPNRQDTMGFAIVGPGTFVASGHPAEADAKKGAPPHLGLIRSTDAGQTWTTVSEAGEADFHALQQAGQTLYAYDSQTRRVRHSSDGGRSWTLGERLAVNDLGAYKDRPEEVYAATPEGLRKSDDSGGTFEAVSDAPVLTHVDVVDGKTLIGVAPDGRIHVKAGDVGWQRLGRLPDGQAAAFTAVGSRHLLAGTEDGSVYESRDGGRTFDVLYGAR
ncbi:F510_1955 family glycosylhydrolase [Actinomadura sp. 6K520]|uniref:F510_1955 family glycosylhydrolase n=1 Tax=Actinomadura sp. 6K520 TaxID=2530364 RepID=UPI001050EDB5|nr:sialidase family protein [Actinomadura sp. 6K520]TDE27372.1 exo-alpha-sialidase [Actinomadura sp. 6K520]